MINERPREAEPEPVPTLTEKLANPAFLFMGMMLLYIIEDIVSACVYPMDMLWRLFCVLSLAILPLSTLLLILPVGQAQIFINEASNSNGFSSLVSRKSAHSLWR